MNLYRVRDWNLHYENNRTRELKRLEWVPVPNRMDGSGYSELVDHPNGAAHLGAWLAILEIASRCKVRGTLTKDLGTIPQEGAGKCGGVPMGSVDLARISRLPVAVFEEVMPRLHALGWLEVVYSSELSVDLGTIPQEGAGKCGSDARARSLPFPSIQFPSPETRARDDANGVVHAIPAPTPRRIPAPVYPFDGWARRLYERHPKKKDRGLVEFALLSVLEKSDSPPTLFAEIDRVHSLWCQQFAWTEKSGQYAPPLARWLDDHGWTAEPKANISAEEFALDEYDRLNGKI